MPLTARQRRSPSDITVAEWALIDSLLPLPAVVGMVPAPPHRRTRSECAPLHLPLNGPQWA